MKKYFYYDENGRIAFYSDGLNQTELQTIELEVIEKELEKFNEGWRGTIYNENLHFEKTPRVLKFELKEKLKNPHLKFEDIKEDLIQLLT